jgi:hypothetical protein
MGFRQPSAIKRAFSTKLSSRWEAMAQPTTSREETSRTTARREPALRGPDGSSIRKPFPASIRNRNIALQQIGSHGIVVAAIRAGYAALDLPSA